MNLINWILLSGGFLLAGLFYSPWWNLGATAVSIAALVTVWRELKVRR